MKQVAVIGCGVVGAMIAYELSRHSQLRVTVFDRQPPAQAATGAALGVLMGIISQKTKGRAWKMRQASIQRYATLLPELLEAGEPLPWNRQGILLLCDHETDLKRWQRLIDLRQQQGWQLQLWLPEQVQQRCPQVEVSQLKAAIYSSQDYQVDPTRLTLALVNAARQRGVDFRFDIEIESLIVQPQGVCLNAGDFVAEADWVIIAAGLGSTPLVKSLDPQNQSVITQPVLGQAMLIRLPQPLGHPDFQPVITGNDIHIVPISHPVSHIVPISKAPVSSSESGASEYSEYWVGATVEFPADCNPAPPAAECLDAVWQGAIAICPALADATILKTWTGLRPRPLNRPAPIVERLSGYSNVLVATGHYRNGVLLAPATAQQVEAILLNLLNQEPPN